MGPILMLENTTDELGFCDSTLAGTPDVVAHVPRATPGVEADEVVG